MSLVPCSALLPARISLALAAFLFAASAGHAQTSPLVEPFGFHDYGGTGPVLNILPPGQKGVFNSVEQAQIAAVCDPTAEPQTCSRNPADYPDFSIDQLLMYDGLLQGHPTLTPDQLRDFFKDATFGTPPHKIAREYSPGGRPGVVVIRDAEHGVPRIYANNRTDAIYASGYTSAEDRLFLMDILRHVGRGRMSEFLGPSQSNLNMDRDIIRNAGYDEAELQWMIDHLDDEDPQFGAITQQAFSDFSDGVNQYITDALADPTKLPAEYVTLQSDPAFWTPTDTVAVAVLIGATFGVGGGGEVRNCDFLAQLEDQFTDPLVARQVFEDFNQDDDPEKPSSTDDSFPYLVQGAVDPAAVACPDPPSMARVLRDTSLIADGTVETPNGLLPLRLDSRASNALLVGKDRSATGYPMAVFGPQTGYFSPQILWELEIHAPGDAFGPTIDARGAAFPGISLLVLLGRGRDFAWSATSAGADLRDVVAAPLCEPGGGPASFDSRHFLYQGQCLPMYQRTDIWIAKPGPGGIPDQPPSFPAPSQDPPPLPDLDDDPLFLFGPPDPITGNVVVTSETLRTVHGIVQSFANINGQPHAYVLQRSTFFHEVDGATAFTKLNSPDHVQDGFSFQQAMAGLNFTFNWFYVDWRGIVYQVSGHYPRRAAEIDFDLPYFATGQWDWQNWANTSSLPSPPNNGDWSSDKLDFLEIPKDANPAKGYITSWNNAQAPDWNSADANLSYGPLHRSQPLDDRISADPSITPTELVQYMEDAGNVDLRGDKVVPVLDQLLGSTGDASADLGMPLLNTWNASGAHRRDLDGDGDYDHSAAVELMDRWWRGLPAVLDPETGAEIEPAIPSLLDVVFAGLSTGVRNAMPLGRHDAPGNVGSAFISGWYGIVHKDLRGVIAGSPVAPWSRLYCGDGVLADCRNAITANLSAIVQRTQDDLGSDPATWDFDEDGDDVRYSLAGTANVPSMDWINRPTFQQVVEFRLDAQGLGDTDRDGLLDTAENCPFVANPGQANTDGGDDGDACECGDVDLDGDVDQDDADLLDDAINELATLDPDSLCDVTHDLDCDASDVAQIAAFVGGSATKADLVCRAKIGPGLLPEPGALVSLVAGFAALLALRRRRSDG